MEDFMNLAYAKWLWLPIKQLPEPRPVLNIDGTENKSGKLKYYTDLNVQMGQNTTTLWFFLSNLGEHKVMMERHDLIPLTSGSDRREVPGIEATGHFSDT